MTDNLHNVTPCVVCETTTVTWEYRFDEEGMKVYRDGDLVRSYTQAELIDWLLGGRFRIVPGSRPKPLSELLGRPRSEILAHFGWKADQIITDEATGLVWFDKDEPLKSDLQQRWDQVRLTRFEFERLYQLPPLSEDDTEIGVQRTFKRSRPTCGPDEAWRRLVRQRLGR